jgi:hypothetical protein
VLDVLGGACVGQASGQVGQHPEGYVEFADGEQARVLVESAGPEIDDQRLRADLPSHRVAGSREG